MPTRTFFSRHLRNTIFITFTTEQFTATCLETHKQFATKPVLAIKAPNRIVALGNQAEQLVRESPQEYRLISPFQHPRLALHEFEVATALVQYAVVAVRPRFMLAKPVMIIHPLTPYEGGLFDIEQLALRDLLRNAGAAQAYVWAGRPLSEAEALALDFPDPSLVFPPAG